MQGQGQGQGQWLGEGVVKWTQGRPCRQSGCNYSYLTVVDSVYVQWIARSSSETKEIKP